MRLFRVDYNVRDDEGFIVVRRAYIQAFDRRQAQLKFDEICSLSPRIVVGGNAIEVRMDTVIICDSDTTEEVQS